MRIPLEYRACDLRNAHGEVSHVPVVRERELRALERDAWANRDAESAVVKALVVIWIDTQGQLSYTPPTKKEVFSAPSKLGASFGVKVSTGKGLSSNP